MTFYPYFINTLVFLFTIFSNFLSVSRALWFCFLFNSFFLFSFNLLTYILYGSTSLIQYFKTKLAWFYKSITYGVWKYNHCMYCWSVLHIYTYVYLLCRLICIYVLRGFIWMLFVASLYSSTNLCCFLISQKPIRTARVYVET